MGLAQKNRLGGRLVGHHCWMDLLLQILFACPKCWRVAGQFLSGVCASWFLVSLSLMRRLDRAEGRFGVVLPDQVLDALPLATTGWGLAGLAIGCASGLYLMWLGRWLERHGSGVKKPTRCGLSEIAAW